VGGNSSDDRIIAGSLQEPGEFGLLFERHSQSIHRYLARRVGVSLAEELTADTFVTAFRLRNRYDTNYTDARPWLFGIAANQMRRHWRSEKRKLRAYARTGLDPVVDETPDAERRVDAAATGPQLARALASIPPKDREALLLLAWGDLSYEEIARALEIPVGTVRSRISRARSRLRELISPEGQLQVEPMPAEGGNDG
jgi:RNA polymerase sigma factor (sigma-70 family)